MDVPFARIEKAKQRLRPYSISHVDLYILKMAVD